MGKRAVVVLLVVLHDTSTWDYTDTLSARASNLEASYYRSVVSDSAGCLLSGKKPRHTRESKRCAHRRGEAAMCWVHPGTRGSTVGGEVRTEPEHRAAANDPAFEAVCHLRALRRPGHDRVECSPSSNTKV